MNNILVTRMEDECAFTFSTSVWRFLVVVVALGIVPATEENTEVKDEKDGNRIDLSTLSKGEHYPILSETTYFNKIKYEDIEGLVSRALGRKFWAVPSF